MQKMTKLFVTFPTYKDNMKKKKNAKIRAWAVSFSTQKLLLQYIYVTNETRLLLT